METRWKLQVVVELLPENLGRPTRVLVEAPKFYTDQKLGLTVMNLAGSMIEQLGLNGETGAFVLSIDKSRIAAREGLTEGMLIQEIKRQTDHRGRRLHRSHERRFVEGRDYDPDPHPNRITKGLNSSPTDLQSGKRCSFPFSGIAPVDFSDVTETISPRPRCWIPGHPVTLPVGVSPSSIDCQVDQGCQPCLVLRSGQFKKGPICNLS